MSSGSTASYVCDKARSFCQVSLPIRQPVSQNCIFLGMAARNARKQAKHAVSPFHLGPIPVVIIKKI